MAKPPTSLERIYETADMRLPGAIRAAIRTELFMVLDEFFRRSMAWVEPVEFSVRPDKRRYDLTPSMGTIVYLHSVSSHEDREFFHNAVISAPDEVELRNYPTRSERLVASVSLTLTDPTTREGDPFVPLPVLERYRNTIIDGLLARMMTQPAKPYTNLAVGTMHNTRFVSGCSRARNETVNQGVPTKQAWRFPRNFTRS